MSHPPCALTEQAKALRAASKFNTRPGRLNLLNRIQSFPLHTDGFLTNANVNVRLNVKEGCFKRGGK